MYFINNEIFEMITHSWKRIRSKRSEIHTDNSLYFCDAHIFYYKFENDFIDVKYFCRYYDIYHNWKVPGENFLLLTYRTYRFIFYVELSNLWTVTNIFFCLLWFLDISYGERIMHYFASGFILHQLQYFYLW